MIDWFVSMEIWSRHICIVNDANQEVEGMDPYANFDGF